MISFRDCRRDTSLFNLPFRGLGIEVISIPGKLDRLPIPSCRQSLLIEFLTELILSGTNALMGTGPSRRI